MDQQSTQLGYRKSQQATTATKTNLLGKWRNPKISAGEQEFTAQARTATKATPNKPAGEQPTKGEQIIHVESNCTSNSTGNTVSHSVGDKPTEER